MESELFLLLIHSSFLLPRSDGSVDSGCPTASSGGGSWPSDFDFFYYVLAFATFSNHCDFDQDN
jgi:hypothetical protein